MKDLHDLSLKARNSFYQLSSSPAEQRNRSLACLCDVLRKNADRIFDANREDYALAEKAGLAAPLLGRLRFGPEKLKQVCDGLQALAQLPDPIGKTTLSTEITEGLTLYRVVCPIGVIGVIFESRPDALIQIASLCVKSGNSVLLKGGSEALRTNQILCACVREALWLTDLPEDSVQLLETREDVASMLKEDRLIDLIIPRGSNAFVRYIMDNSRIPVLGHADGVCHVYIDASADPRTAVKVTVDSKTQNLSVCNAAETLLVHREAVESCLRPVIDALREKGVRILGDPEVVRLAGCDAADESDWSKEYLDAVISVRIVPSLDEAISHINRYGSHHTDCIITEDADAASRFMNIVDSAGVYWNASTRFADGFVYGFGAEVGISTGKIHARGPMGLDGLTTCKFKLIGKGHTIAEMKDGTRKYTHRSLNGACPF